MWKEYLNTNRHDNGYTHDKIPSDGKLIKRPFEEVVRLLVHSDLISVQEAVVNNDEHNCCVEILSYKYSKHSEYSAVYFILHFLNSSHFIQNNLQQQIQK